MYGITTQSTIFASNDSLNIVLKRFFENLPSKPYCSNGFDIEGTKINRKIEAVKKKYIQFNHPQWKKYIVIDIDRPGALVDWIYDQSYLPAPNLVIENPKNGHAHFVYELIDAVSFTERSSLKAQKYYTAVVKALTEELKGDARYNGVLSKNPNSSAWRTTSYRAEPYHLKELASKVVLTYEAENIEEVKAENDEYAINGRNDEVFHTVRHLAYKDIREFKNNSGLLFNHWFEHVLNLVREKNSNFLSPMDYQECAHIAKSISKYCWKNHEECYKHFIERQRNKGAKGGTNRSAKYEDARRAAKELFRKAIPLKEIALQLNISYRSVLRYTKGLKIIKLLSFNEINEMRKSALADKSTKRSEVHKKSTERSEGINNAFKGCDNSQNQVLALKRAPLAPFGAFLKKLFLLHSENLKIKLSREGKILIYYSKPS